MIRRQVSSVDIYGQPDNLTSRKHLERYIWLIAGTKYIFEERKNEGMNVCFKVKYLQLLTGHNFPFFQSFSVYSRQSCCTMC